MTIEVNVGIVGRLIVGAVKLNVVKSGIVYDVFGIVVESSGMVGGEVSK